MNGVFIIPTGIGCEIGGHAGDANPAVKLIASVCDKLIVNPNAVNASDINEMPDNCLYVEGSMIDRFLQGEFLLEEVKRNKVLVVTNAPLKTEVINSVNAARATIGLEAEIAVLDFPLTLVAKMNPDGSAGGFVGCWEELCGQVSKYNFDALAITTQIGCPKEVAINYFEKGGVNPWGAVEAIASKLISKRLNKPVAHSPVEPDWVLKENYNPPATDPRVSAEMVSVSYLHCILKGLWKAPRISPNSLNGMHFTDLDFLVTPFGCWGEPHKACAKRNIPIIVVEENKTILQDRIGKVIWAKSYLEALGVIQAMKIGVTRESVRRPLVEMAIH